MLILIHTVGQLGWKFCEAGSERPAGPIIHWGEALPSIQAMVIGGKQGNDGNTQEAAAQIAFSISFVSFLEAIAVVSLYLPPPRA